MIRSVALMGTIVTIHVVGPERDDAAIPLTSEPEHASEREEAERNRASDLVECIESAFEWFRRVEACCTRFDPDSELMRLTAHVGVEVPVSELLFEAVHFAIAVAEETRGAFDPTIGHQMETRGFNREYRSGRVVETALGADAVANYRDVSLDTERRTITLHRPLVLDLGAVAKGMAIDLAARELQSYGNFAIDAGGDLYLAGLAPGGEPWSIGIRHPRLDRQLIDAVRVSNMAVCTSGDYEREIVGDGARPPKGSPVPLDPRLPKGSPVPLDTRSPQGSPVPLDASLDEPRVHHILDPRTGESADAVVSVTVLAPTAMVADALATAAFVLGPAEGIRLLERQGVDGLIVSPAMGRFTTRGMRNAAVVH